MEIRVKLDTSKVLKALNEAPVEVAKACRVAMKKATREIQVEARKKKNHRFTTRSGNLERSISTEVSNPFSGKVFIDLGTAKYGVYVHEGWGTKGRKQSAGNTVKNFLFGKSRKGVKKGWAPDPFLENALEAKRNEVMKLLHDGVANALKVVVD